MKPRLGQRSSKTDFYRPLQVGLVTAEPTGAEQITKSEVAGAKVVRHDCDMPNLTDYDFVDAPFHCAPPLPTVTLKNPYKVGTSSR